MARKAYGQKKVTITFSDGGNAIFFSILRLTQIIWEIERGDEFCSLPIDVKKIICILFWQSRFALCTYFNKSPPPTPGCNFVKIFADGTSAVN